MSHVFRKTKLWSTEKNFRLYTVPSNGDRVVTSKLRFSVPEKTAFPLTRLWPPLVDFRDLSG